MKLKWNFQSGFKEWGAKGSTKQSKGEGEREVYIMFSRPTQSFSIKLYLQEPQESCC